MESLSEDQQSSSDESDERSLEFFPKRLPVLTTRNLTLRAPEMGDVDVISLLANNVAVAKMLTRMPYPYGKKDAEHFVKHIANNSENKTHSGTNGKYTYAITRTTDHAFMGCCSIEKKQGSKNFEIGYWLGEPYWHKGYATEVAQALVDFGFTQLSTNEIHGSCRVINPASRRILQKCGFQILGMGTTYCLAENAQVSVERYRLDRKAWQSIKNWAKPDIEGTKNDT